MPGMPICATRSLIRSRPFPSGVAAMQMPDRSPFTSAQNTGTPAAENCSAITCSVTVLPVPVAPATSPCRFARASNRPCGAL